LIEPPISSHILTDRPTSIDITDKWPEDGIIMNVRKMLKARGIDLDE
jgi:hypothetical protein